MYSRESQHAISSNARCLRGGVLNDVYMRSVDTHQNQTAIGRFPHSWTESRALRAVESCKGSVELLMKPGCPST